MTIVLCIIPIFLCLLAYYLYKRWTEENHDAWSKKIFNMQKIGDSGWFTLDLGKTEQEIIDGLPQVVSLEDSVVKIKWWKQRGRLVYVIQIEEGSQEFPDELTRIRLGKEIKLDKKRK